jgi:hypothetical protein
MNPSKIASLICINFDELERVFDMFLDKRSGREFHMIGIHWTLGPRR